ncbi:LmeA family phospholipid-binding protein [Epidermidibacterium keratini]|uniref:LmeA family phospholipid-binding protein n=1 Tax=Epidermidibacterium keratini TaxID=1891644 RepID=A0A7L4YKR1_9ACTN|nr:DUF2993 domain-containing protein [Epidermidibacterium keratini]QHB99840.1 LmeA family phospholipid-binding protein [Epidermidibacterium keratini]
MKKLLVGLLVLALLLVGADIAARLVAERVLASTLQQRLSLPQRPDVSIGGFSVLVQAVRGTYDEVRVEALGVPTDNIGQLDYLLTFNGIDLPISKLVNQDVSGTTARSATAEVSVSEQTLSDLAGRPIAVSSGQGGAVQLETTYDIAGASVDLQVTADVQVQGEQVVIDVQDVSAAGVTIPSSVIGAVADAIGVNFPLPPAIRGLTLTDVTARDGAIILHAQGNDVPLSGA